MVTYKGAQTVVRTPECIFLLLYYNDTYLSAIFLRVDLMSLAAVCSPDSVDCCLRMSGATGC